MAKIADVIHASAVFQAACQDWQWAYDPRNIWTYPLRSAADRVMGVLVEAEKRCVTALLTNTTREEAVMVTEETRPIQEPLRAWLTRVENVAQAMRAAAREELLPPGPGRVLLYDALIVLACLLYCVPNATTTTINDITVKLKALMVQYDQEGYTIGLPLGQQSSITHDVPLGSQRGDDKQRIITIITQMEEWIATELGILPILGPGGIGKTTLLKSIFSDPRFEDYTKVWVDTPSVDQWNKIYRSIIDQALLGAESSHLQDGNSLDRMKNHLSMLFGSGNKKLLLVLDDLCVKENRFSYNWAANVDNLKYLLSGIGRNLVVIVTTTIKDIADYMSNNTIIRPYQLHPLSHDMCWAIIKETSCFEARTAGSHQEAEAAERKGRDIASKCCGLPVAAKALGCFLRSVDPQQWPTLVGNSQGIWNVGGGYYNDGSQPPLHIIIVFSHLKQACFHLSCKGWLSFATCAFHLSKGQSICRDDLHWQWDALRVCPSSHGHETSKYLLAGSLLLRKKSASNATADEDSMLVIMEEMMHDFARYLLGDRLVVVDGRRNGATTSPDVNKRSNAYLAVVRNWRQLDVSRILPAGILALRFEDCREIMELSDSAFSRVKCLRVLDLSGCSLKKLPESIGQLQHLRYLNAPGIQDRVLPVFLTRLEELRFLSLRGSRRLSDLTEAFGRLRRLEHLDLSGCSGLKALPNSFCDIYNLKHLDLSGCSCLGGITEAVGGASRFEYLNLSHPCAYSSVEDWFHLKGLDALLQQHERGLRFLGLSSCLNPLCYTSPPDKCKAYLGRCISRLFSLRHLDLSHNSFLEELPESIAKLKQLHTLDLSGCFRLESLPGGIGELRELRALLLSSCFRLGSLPETIRKLQKLETLDLSGCPPFDLITNIKSHGRLTIITDEAQGPATTPQDASFVDQSSGAEPEITENPDYSQ